MSTATLNRAGARAAGRSYGFGSTAMMEWLKLRSVRSTPAILLIFSAGMIGLSILVLKNEDYGSMSAADRATFDPTNDGFTGLIVGQLAFGVLGVLAITSEFASGMIRSTLAAVPRRPMLLAAKAVVAGTVMLVAGEILAFLTFVVGQAALGSSAPHAALGQPGVLRAVLMAGAFPALIGLIGLGLGAIIRNTAAAISALAGIIFVIPLVLVPLGDHLHHAIGKFMPLIMASNSLVAVKPVPDSLAPGVAFGLLCLYAVAALGIGGWLLARRDA
ncbi:MAG: ABC transporter permease [Streptosporangiaceae bacterium]